MVQHEYLWHLICCGAAVIYANNQCGVDIVIPMLMGTVTDKISNHLFIKMNPLKVTLFMENEAKAPLPLVPQYLIISPPKNGDKFTAYNLWIAGVSGKSFGVIPDMGTGTVQAPA